MPKKTTELEKALSRIEQCEQSMRWLRSRDSLLIDTVLACIRTLERHDPGAAKAYHAALYAQLDKLNAENK